MKKSIRLSRVRLSVLEKPAEPKTLRDLKRPMRDISAWKSTNAAPVITQQEVKLSKSELRRLKEMFDTADLNSDGLIDHEDLSLLIKQLNMYATRKQVNKMIRAYDPNDTGSVDFKRFCQMMSAEERMPPDDEAREMFNAIDREGNGFVARSDLRQFFASIDSNVTANDVEDIFRALDADNDGKLTMQEFLAVSGFLD